MPKSPDRVAILGDVLRPHTAVASRSEAVTRTRWLADLLSPPIREAAGVAVECLTADRGALEFGRLYADAGLVPSDAAWAGLFAGPLPESMATAILDACDGALVLGIELPPSVSAILARAGVPALDCHVHPLRFLDDIPLGWRATSSDVAQALAGFAVPAFDVERAVARIRAKMRWLADPVQEPGTTLVLDQLPTDAALIDPAIGRIVSWERYVAELQELARGGPVLWRAHPYNPDDTPLASLLGPERRTTGNIYGLLASDNLARVVAISSGGVVEGRAFGKEGVHLLDRRVAEHREGWSDAVPVVGHWLSPHFWSAVLAPWLPTSASAPVAIAERDAFRRANNTDWDFGWIDQVVAHGDAPLPPARRMARAEGRLDAIEEAGARAIERLGALEASVDGLHARIADLESRAAGAEHHVARLSSALRHQVRAVIDGLLAELGADGGRIGVLGAGSHTAWLLEQTRLGTHPDLVVFDRSPALHGARVGGHLVHDATLIPTMGLSAIVVSSLAFEDEMVDYLESLAIDRLRITRCYRA